MTQASSHLVNKLAYIFFLRKFKVISKTISNNFHIHQIPHKNCLSSFKLSISKKASSNVITILYNNYITHFQNKISIQRYDQKFQYKNIANISKNNNDEKKFIQQKRSNKLQ